MRRPVLQWLLIAIFGVLGGNALNEAAHFIRNPGIAPAALMWLQAATGATSLAVMAGIWRRARWSVPAIGVWGVVAASMVASLGPLLQLDPISRGGLLIGSATLLALAGASAWYMHYSLTRAQRIATLRSGSVAVRSPAPVHDRQHPV